jgi:hypothetical protein
VAWVDDKPHWFSVKVWKTWPSVPLHTTLLRSPFV